MTQEEHIKHCLADMGCTHVKVASTVTLTCDQNEVSNEVIKDVMQANLGKGWKFVYNTLGYFLFTNEV